HIKVVLTREDDRYIELQERTRIANRANADLFVSIHMNAHRNHRVRGIETYILNWTNDEEALRVAARENQITIKEMKQKQGTLSVILASLRRSAKRDHSLKLAYLMHNEILKKVAKRYRLSDNGIKQALFYVLVGAEMPSVLVELAYISNPKEAKLLKKKTVQWAYAEAIARAIYRYLMSLPGAPKLAMAQNNLTKYD
ncbi:MAG: N-acetylmuramoyl-L-alanine amidase, partial [Nitrospirae bacterium]